MFTYPKYISNYKLIKPLYSSYNHRSFKYALYEYEGQKVFAKIWQGKRKNFDYGSLINEINVYQAFNSRRFKKSKLFLKYPGVKIPSLLYFEIRSDFIVMLVEFIDGVSLKRKTENIIIDNFILLLNFFSEATFYIDKTKIKKRSIKFVPIYFFVYFLITLVKYPKQYRILIKSLLLLILNFKYVYVSNNVSFVHKSLEGKNVILCDDFVYIIDFQLSEFSHPLIELAQTFAFYPYPAFVNKMIVRLKMKNSAYYLNRNKLLSLLSIYTCLQQLALSNELINERMNLIVYLNKKF